MLADRLNSAMTATFDLLAVYVGERLGWYAALAGEPRTPAELAAATGTNERYAREAGFADAVVLDIEHDAFRFYRLK